MGEQLIGRSFGLGPKLGDGVGEVDGVPEDDGGDREVETGGTVALVFRRCGPGSPRDDGQTGRGTMPSVRFGTDSAMPPPLTMRAYRHVIPNGTYHFPRAIEGGNLLEYATACFRNDEDFGPSAQPLMQPIGRSCATFREMPARAQASTTFDTSL